MLIIDAELFQTIKRGLNVSHVLSLVLAAI